ncbi:CRISPR-associated helicase Cas3' [Kitasatospora sp. NA04385]|uniref:CRISPR-associated helicase Cas3' n=1 Tax=Kitasatospora sp. NA04385 TaxID=2742135 RepID=UPI00158FEFFC|nr:CRISPR-associated helicase Cas3' [Kitasatospora sp. NA04385]QKW20545.1 CRISPR-associated helicase Cas3' [Kitasatospora sp. NA04385]
MDTSTRELRGLLAKSAKRGQPAEELTAHLAATLTAGSELAHRIGRIDAAEGPLKDLFWPAAQLGGLCHDSGKITDGFQKMVRDRAQPWGERHEVVSLGFLPALVPDGSLLPWVAAGVATHHRALTGSTGRDLRFLYEGLSPDELAERIGHIDDPAVQAMAGWLRTTAASSALPTAPRPADAPNAGELLDAAHDVLDCLLERWSVGVDTDTGLAAALLQGAVTLADHLSSAHGTLHTDQPFNHRFRPTLEKRMAHRGQGLREHQLRAAATTGHMLLHAPTGSGKTEALLLWAALQITELAHRMGGTPRLFYVLPYLASINAMADRFADLLGDPGLVGVAHSRAASYHLAAAIRPTDDTDQDTEHPGRPAPDEAAKALSRQAATRLFRESVRVGTPYQLLRAALAGPAHAGLLVDAANSVFILDELHAYDPRRLGYILAAARLWERLGGRIAVASATLPDALADLFTTTLTHQPTLIDTPDLGLPPRHRLQVRHRHLTHPATAAEVRAQLELGRSVLVVANNIAHALALFTCLAPHCRALHGNDSAFLLHSRFERRDRSRIERRIGARFASTAAHRMPGLLVATQAVEVSLDLDLDVLFTAAAVLEALLQRFGRVNRLGLREPADVIVHAPAWTRRSKQPGEFADGIYPREPVEAAWRHLLDHRHRIIDETDATGWLNIIYTTDWGRRWHHDVIAHRRSFENAFLTFHYPFADRSRLSRSFDELFDGTEAVLEQHLDAYTQALAQGTRAEGRLLADEYLIPLSPSAVLLSRYEHALDVHVLDADYDPDLGLLNVRGHPPEAHSSPS